MHGLKRFDGESEFALRVFDHVTFVENAIQEIRSLQEVNVASDGFVRGDDHVMMLELSA